jgi:Carboxypeptidase regulatory-like domain/TonB dependent receptor
VFLRNSRKIQEGSVNKRYRGFFTVFSVVVLLLGVALAGNVSAQIISGDLVGTVLDKTGAVVPSASVEAVNADTGVRYTAKANQAGEYRFNNLPVGTYNVSASSSNFATTTVNGFKVELNKTSTLQITLEIKGAVTTVEVSGVAPALDTTTAQLSSTFEERQLADLPSATAGSGVLNLSLLSSGVATSGGVGAGTGPAVGGQRPRNNNFTIEGVDNNDKGVTGPLVTVPNDAVAEFSLLQNNFSAEFGHSSGGQFNTVVKSGTNSYHGLAYIYNENRNYNALDTLQKDAGLTTVPRFDQNRFGGQFGGPILKNKLFFFANYEYEPLGQVGTPGAACAPDAAGMATIMATSGINQTNLGIFQKYVPLGTVPDNAQNGCGPIAFGTSTVTTKGLSFPIPSFQNTKNLVISGDYDISAKDQLRARYIWNNVAGLDTSPTLPVFFTPIPARFYLVTINEYHQFSTNVQNEFRLGFNRFFNQFGVGNQTFPGLDQFPNLTYDDLNFLNLGPDPNAPQGAIQNTYQAVEAVSWVKGRHTAKFGFEARKVISPQLFIQRSRGDYEYSSLFQYLTDGFPDTFAERSTGGSPYYGDQTAWYGFAQDNWRIRPNFTLNLGLRYEYTTIPATQKLQSLNAIASVPGLVTFRTPTPAPNNWAPRIGFAWSPGTSGRTSIRAGAGEAYDILYDNLGILSGPPELSSTYDCAAPGQPGYNCQPSNPLYAKGFLTGGGIPNFPVVPFTSQAAAAASTAAYVPVNQQVPKSIDWTLGVQHTFGKDYTVEARYVGDRGIHLPTQVRLNNEPQVTNAVFLPTYTTAPSQATLDALPFTLAGIKASAYGNPPKFVPAWAAGNFNRAAVVSFEPWAASTYHGLATQLTRRFSNGLQFVASYTFSHTIDDATADVFSTVLSPRRAQDWLQEFKDRSNSILDHHQRATLGLVYEVPYFKNRSSLVKNVAGNWTIAPIYTYQSGQWVTAQSGVDSNLNGDSAGDRPIFNAQGTAGVGSGVTALTNTAGATVAYLANNPNARFIVAGPGALSNVGRNTLQLRPIDNIDVTAGKRITITERYRVEFQAQAFNVFNHAQYIGGFLNDVASIGFTQTERSMLIPSDSHFNQPQTVFSSNPRTLQLALKLFF